MSKNRLRERVFLVAASSTYPPFIRSFSPRNRQASRRTSLGARRGSQHKWQTAGKHPKRTVSCAKRLFAACTLGSAVISVRQVWSGRLQARSALVTTTWVGCGGTSSKVWPARGGPRRAGREPAELIEEGPRREDGAGGRIVRQALHGPCIRREEDDAEFR